LNVLDLGIWFSIASAVRLELLSPQLRSKKVFDRIRAAVEKAWEVDWDARPKLESVFDTKMRVIQAVIATKGSNEYQMPRSPYSRAGEPRAAFIPEKPEFNLAAAVDDGQDAMDLDLPADAPEGDDGDDIVLVESEDFPQWESDEWESDEAISLYDD
jgi:hypothetical protein